MRRHVLSFVSLLIGLSGCQEYTIEGFGYTNSVPNPPSLTTPLKTDIILQTTPSKVDVLFVLDSSSSMAEEQEKLARNLPVFLEYFQGSGLSWHIGVVSTDTDGNDAGHLRTAAGYHLITESTPEPSRLFEHIVRVGVSGSGDEKGLLATFLALSQGTPVLADANRGMNRDDAALHIIMVSDEEDSSGDQQSPFELADYLQTIKVDAGLPVTFNSIVGPGPVGCNNDETTAFYGRRYQQVTDTIGGEFWSICQRDWAPILQALGSSATSIRKEFYLSEVPAPGTLLVQVDDRGIRWTGFDVAGPGPADDECVASETEGCFAYRYNERRNSITFLDYVPTPRAEIRLTYALLGEAQQDLYDTDTVDQ